MGWSLCPERLIPTAAKASVTYVNTSARGVRPREPDALLVTNIQPQQSRGDGPDDGGETGLWQAANAY
jgi:hypothetical protein